jgi:hypothetical protein
MLKKIPTDIVRSTNFSRPEVSRLLTAAVISHSFRSMLLNDPAKAIAGGYSGERFQMDSAEKHQVTSIHASTLAEFATQLAEQY